MFVLGRHALSRSLFLVVSLASGAFAAPADAPAPHTSLKPVVAQYSDQVPPVMLTDRQSAWCKVQVGDVFPALELPRAVETGVVAAPLKSLYGKQATVVIFWRGDRWMSRAALSDLAKDVAAKNDASQIAVLGVSVLQPAEAAPQAATQVKANFPQFVDPQGTSLAKVGTPSLPRIYILDAAGKIAWFDIEYSEATRREIAQTLSALVALTTPTPP